MDTSSKILKNEPLVSITMITYNNASYICEAIESVLSQTYENWELIIIDDGSTDATTELVKLFNDVRIRYIKNTSNKGIYASRTQALAESQGTYIAILDSDDMWNDQNKLEIQVSFLETHADYVLIGTFIKKINSRGKQTGINNYYTDDTSIRSHLLLRNQFAHSSVLMRSSLIKMISGYHNVIRGEDLELFLRMGRHGKFANIPEYMVSYRIHENGASRNGLLMAKAVQLFIWQNRHYYKNTVPAIAKNTFRIVFSIFFDTRTLRNFLQHRFYVKK